MARWLAALALVGCSESPLAPSPSDLALPDAAVGDLAPAPDLAGPHPTIVPSGTTADLNDVIRDGSGGYLAVGANGTILHSDDGARWSREPSDTTATLYAVGYGCCGGEPCAVGASGALLRRDSGRWSSVVTNIPEDLRGLDGGRGTLFVGTKGSIYAPSVDCSSFSRRESGVTDTLYGVASYYGLELAWGDHGVILSSDDQGATWRRRPAVTDHALRRSSFDDSPIFVGDVGAAVLWPCGEPLASLPTATARDLIAVAPYCNIVEGCCGKGPLAALGADGTSFLALDGADAASPWRAIPPPLPYPARLRAALLWAPAVAATTWAGIAVGDAGLIVLNPWVPN